MARQIEPAESPAERFERLMEQRLARAEDQIRLIGNLANSGMYDFDAGDKTAIFDRLLIALEAAEKKFNMALHKKARRQLAAGQSQVGSFRSEGGRS